MDAQTLRAKIDADDGLSGIATQVDMDSLSTSNDPAHGPPHLLRVALWTLRLGEGRIDSREGIAAALLHDFINIPKDDPRRNQASALSAEAARPLLAVGGFTPEAIDRIAAAIRDHSFSRGATPKGPLGCALQDADRLEALGAIGLMRCVATGQKMGSGFFHPDDPWAERRELNDRAYSVDHLFTKLFSLSDTMCTEPGRREAVRRTRFLHAFITSLGDELGYPKPNQTKHSTDVP